MFVDIRFTLTIKIINLAKNIKLLIFLILKMKYFISRQKDNSNKIMNTPGHNTSKNELFPELFEKINNRNSGNFPKFK